MALGVLVGYFGVWGFFCCVVCFVSSFFLFVLIFCGVFRLFLGKQPVQYAAVYLCCFNPGQFYFSET